MKHQELNGITDWFQSGIDYTSDVIADAAFWATEATGTTDYVLAATDVIDEKLGQLSKAANAQVDTFVAQMNKLLKAQKMVDEGIESMPEGPAKNRLIMERDNNRGVFAQYIAPAWETFRQWVGYEDDANYGMGLAITGSMVAGAAVVLSVIGVAIPYIASNLMVEMKILNDPELKKTYAASRGSLISLGGNVKYLAIGAAGLGIIYLLSSSGLLSKRG